MKSKSKDNSKLTGNTTAVTGCALYTGRNNNDAAGTWRLPNVHELVLISLYEQAFQTTEGTTGYVLMNNDYHWTAFEETATRAYYVASYGINTGYYSVGSAAKTKSYFARCVKDY